MGVLEESLDGRHEAITSTVLTLEDGGRKMLWGYQIPTIHCFECPWKVFCTIKCIGNKCLNTTTTAETRTKAQATALSAFQNSLFSCADICNEASKKEGVADEARMPLVASINRRMLAVHVSMR